MEAKKRREAMNEAFKKREKPVRLLAEAGWDLS
jgi:hypothetical protein